MPSGNHSALQQWSLCTFLRFVQRNTVIQTDMIRQLKQRPREASLHKEQTLLIFCHRVWQNRNHQPSAQTSTIHEIAAGIPSISLCMVTTSSLLLLQHGHQLHSRSHLCPLLVCSGHQNSLWVPSSEWRRDCLSGTLANVVLAVVLVFHEHEFVEFPLNICKDCQVEQTQEDNRSS